MAGRRVVGGAILIGVAGLVASLAFVTGGSPAPAVPDRPVPATPTRPDPEALAERVSHPLRARTDGTLGVTDAAYRAAFGPAGFSVAPRAGGAPLGFSLRAVTTGDRSAAPAAAWAADANVAVREVGPSARERVTAQDGDLEWDVVLDAPIGRGDVVVTAGVAGATGDPVLVDGGRAWSWPSDGGRTIHVDELVVVDAAGRELHRALPRATRDAVVLEVPAAALAGARYPVTLDPTISPRFPVSNAARAEGDRELQHDVASNGTVSLSVWSEGDAIVGQRIAADGTPADPEAFVISDDPEAPGTATTHGLNRPAVAAVGSDFLVVWRDQHDLCFEPNCATYQIRAARVSGAGAVLDPAGIDLSASSSVVVDEPDVAGSATQFLVTWQATEAGTGSDIRAGRVSTSGSALDGAGIVVSAAAGDQEVPAAASDGTGFFLAWQSGDVDIRGARVSSAGAVLEPAGTTISAATGTQSLPALAFNGTSYLAAWQDRRSGTSFDIYGARISSAGAVLDAAGIPVSTAAGDQLGPTAAGNGTDALVAWKDQRPASRDIQATVVSAAGVVQQPNGIVLPAVADEADRTPAATALGSTFVVTWDGFGPGRENILGRRVSGTGATVGSVFAVPGSRQLTSQRSVDVAWNGSVFLVVWEEQFDSSSRLYVNRIEPDGTRLDGDGLEVGNDDGSAVNNPTVASDGTDFLVAWQFDDFRDTVAVPDIRGVRISGSGAVLDSTQISIATGSSVQHRPQVAFGGTHYLVVWQEGRGGSGAANVAGARVSTGGSVLDPAGIPISTATGDQELPEVAGGAGGWQVVWEDGRSGGVDVHGARVTAAGAVSDPTGIPISTATGSQRAPSVAFNGTRFLAAWEDERGATDDVYASRITTAGVVQEPAGIAVSTAGGDQQFPEVAPIGAGFLVLWSDRRATGTADTWGTQVDDAGAVATPGGAFVATADHWLTVDGVLAATRGPGDDVGFVYGERNRDTIFGSMRGFLRTYSAK